MTDGGSQFSQIYISQYPQFAKRGLKENRDASCQIILNASRSFVKKSGNVAKAPLDVETDHGHLEKPPLSVARNSIKPADTPLASTKDLSHLVKSPPVATRDFAKLLG